MTTLKFNSPRVPFTDARGNISREWQIFLAGLYERAGGADSQTIPEVAADVVTLTAAVSALNAALLAMRLPVGSIHVSASPTDPATTLGYGTWAAFGTGRVIVGVDVGDTDFDTVEETGGSKTATI